MQLVQEGWQGNTPQQGCRSLTILREAASPEVRRLRLHLAYALYIQSSVDVFFLYRGQIFVWNGQKAIENLTKHGIAFETACEVFFDPSSISEDASVEEEARMALIGKSLRDSLLYIVHLERDGTQIRVISARKATKRERRIYEDGC